MSAAGAGCAWCELEAEGAGYIDPALAEERVGPRLAQIIGRLLMAARICAGWPLPCSAASSAARPVTWGVAWLVPTKPRSRLPAAHAVVLGFPLASNVSRVWLQNDHTHEAMSVPHGHPG